MACRSRSSSPPPASRLFSPDVLRDRLDDRLGLLRSGPRDLPERQQTLRSTIDWSYELLEPGEQRLFELLAVFADADVSAIESVADDVGAIDGVVVDVLDGLAGLVEKSLLRRVDGRAAEPRVAMLQTIRAFATDRLDQRSGRRRRGRAGRTRPTTRTLAGRLRARPGRGRARGRPRTDWPPTSRTCASRGPSGWTRATSSSWTRLAKALLILDDAHGWYLDTVGLASDMLAVLDAVPSSTERINQEIALRTTLARALMATKGFTPEVEAAFASALERFERGVDVGLQFSVLRGLASLYLFRAQLDKSARDRRADPRARRGRGRPRAC